MATVDHRTADGAQTVPGRLYQVAGHKDKSREPAYGMWVVITGLVALVTVVVVASFQFGKASDIATATAGVSGVIAAIVGAYFGIRGASLTHKYQQGQPPAEGEE
jgi:membrane associated rhomboid family serine protease